MNISSNAIVFLIVFVILLIGGIILQVYLSKKENKWYGMILPTLAFVLSLVIVFGLVAYDRNSTSRMFGQIVPIFLLSNIPTLVLLGIYAGGRKKQKLRTQLDKMKIKDLE